ncbi:MAG: stage III sporulation protein AE, partial [Dethiobacteria bacterium]
MFEEQAERLDLQSFDRFWNELQREVGEYVPDFHWRDFFKSLSSGDFELNLPALFSGLGRFLFGEVLLNLN